MKITAPPIYNDALLMHEHARYIVRHKIIADITRSKVHALHNRIELEKHILVAASASFLIDLLPVQTKI
jgi:hypothetical protein